MPIRAVDLTEGEVARRLAMRPGLVWLDGSGDSPQSHFSYIASDPVEITRAAIGSPEPLHALRRLAASSSSTVPRWIGFVAFDAYWHVGSTDVRQHAARQHRRDPDSTAVWFGRYDAVVVFDHNRRQAWIDAEDPSALSRLHDRLRHPPSALPATISNLSSTSAEHHRAAIQRALEHIAEGDIYQVNLARRWHGDFDGHPLRVYEAMRTASPVPLGAYIQADDVTVLSRSMETFLHLDAPTRILSTRPIKGTIARSDSDQTAAATLKADPKEQAEHAMIVDLMRNDLGRIASIGSVEVGELMNVEPYSKLAHLVSTVACHVPDERDLSEIFTATFPPGSISGAPKIRALELIEALESHPRGVYCGAVGYVCGDGSAHFAVAIRTAQVAGSHIIYHAGGGIVAASSAANEVSETDLKASVFLDAVKSLT